MASQTLSAPTGPGTVDQMLYRKRDTTLSASTRAPVNSLTTVSHSPASQRLLSRRRISMATGFLISQFPIGMADRAISICKVHSPHLAIAYLLDLQTLPFARPKLLIWMETGFLIL